VGNLIAHVSVLYNTVSTDVACQHGDDTAITISVTQRFPLRFRNTFRYVKVRYVRHDGVLRCVTELRFVRGRGYVVGDGARAKVGGLRFVYDGVWVRFVMLVRYGGMLRRVTVVRYGALCGCDTVGILRCVTVVRYVDALRWYVTAHYVNSLRCVTLV